MTTPQHTRSLWFGALIAPWVVPVGYPAIILMQYPEPGLVGLIGLFILFGLPFTYLLTALVAIPAILWLRNRNKLSALKLCVLGAVIGPLGLYGYLTLWDGLDQQHFELSKTLGMASMGLISAAVFCWASGVRWRVPKVPE